MRVIGVIPARIGSTRVPEKALADICGMPMVMHVYYRAKMCALLDEVVVATDDESIMDAVHRGGGKAIMTSASHRNPTERVHEVSEKMQGDIYMLLNGDEPLIRPIDIETSLNLLINDLTASASILYVKNRKFNSPSDFKIVLDNDGHVMYISRRDIPSPLKNPADYLQKAYHVMAFYKSTLDQYVSFEKQRLEAIEDHEHIRLLINGITMVAGEVEYECFSVDTDEQLEWVRAKMPDDQLFQKYRIDN